MNRPLGLNLRVHIIFKPPLERAMKEMIDVERSATMEDASIQTVSKEKPIKKLQKIFQWQVNHYLKSNVL